MQVLPRGVRHMPGYLGRDDAGGAGRGYPRRGAGRAALRADHAAHRQADERAHDQLRDARLGDRQGARLPLPADASGDRRAVAADPGAAAAPVAGGLGLPASAGGLPGQFLSMPAPRWACIRTATSRILPRPSSRSRSATTACSASARRTRDGQTVSFRLTSGDVVVLGGEGRLAFHGVDRIYPSTSALLKNGGRINLTLQAGDPARVTHDFRRNFVLGLQGLPEKLLASFGELTITPSAPRATAFW